MNKQIKLIISIVAVAFVASVIFIIAKPVSVPTSGVVQVTNQAPTETLNGSGINPINTTNTGNAANKTNVPAGDLPQTIKKSTKYKNGTYSVTTSYDTPADLQNMGLSITINNDMVIGSTFTNMANDGKSSRYQNAFAGGYKAQIVGKNIDSINLDAVSGASLTSAGFNDALNQIKTTAQI